MRLNETLAWLSIILGMAGVMIALAIDGDQPFLVAIGGIAIIYGIDNLFKSLSKSDN